MAGRNFEGAVWPLGEDAMARTITLERMRCPGDPKHNRNGERTTRCFD